MSLGCLEALHYFLFHAALAQKATISRRDCAWGVNPGFTNYLWLRLALSLKALALKSDAHVHFQATSNLCMMLNVTPA
ncbi:hypothetical protein LSAT2_028692 [Lamellibrachia satsuma]|nr:hypothetical protein LSAT2_028692 [Lamellibrachia satsuma]